MTFAIRSPALRSCGRSKSSIIKCVP